jgi:hypothetical protein
MSQAQQAQQSIASKMVAPGQAEETLVANAEKAIDGVVQKINDFFENKWKGYRSLVESTKVNLFKDYKPIQ